MAGLGAGGAAGGGGPLAGLAAAVAGNGLLAIATGLIVGVLGSGTLLATGAVHVGGGNAAPAAAPVGLQVIACPDAGPVIGSIPRGEKVLVTGRSADGAWLQVFYPGPAFDRAWTKAGPLQLEADPNTLPVASCEAPATPTPRPTPGASTAVVASPEASPSVEPSPSPAVSQAPSPSPSPRPSPSPSPGASPIPSPSPTPKPTPKQAARDRRAHRLDDLAELRPGRVLPLGTEDRHVHGEGVRRRRDHDRDAVLEEARCGGVHAGADVARRRIGPERDMDGDPRHDRQRDHHGGEPRVLRDRAGRERREGQEPRDERPCDPGERLREHRADLRERSVRGRLHPVRRSAPGGLRQPDRDRDPRHDHRRRRRHVGHARLHRPVGRDDHDGRCRASPGTSGPRSSTRTTTGRRPAGASRSRSSPSTRRARPRRPIHNRSGSSGATPMRRSTSEG